MFSPAYSSLILMSWQCTPLRLCPCSLTYYENVHAKGVGTEAMMIASGSPWHPSRLYMLSGLLHRTGQRKNLCKHCTCGMWVTHRVCPPADMAYSMRPMLVPKRGPMPESISSRTMMGVLKAAKSPSDLLVSPSNSSSVDKGKTLIELPLSIVSVPDCLEPDELQAA